MMKRLALRSFLVCLTLLAGVGVQAQTTITLSPATARAGETVTATIKGAWYDSCVPKNPTITTEGRAIRIQARTTCDGACLAAVTQYTLTATFVAPSSDTAGPYAVEYTTVDCTNRKYFEGTAQLMVTSGTCAFADSLIATPASAKPGDAITLMWCNPSTLMPDNAFTVASYRVYRSRSAGGPFTFVEEVQPAANTSTIIPATSSDLGNNYFYVEARGCTTTITGQCIDTALLTRVASVYVAAANACVSNPTTLCLNNGRFELTARWRTSDGNNGSARAVSLTNESGYFWFFTPGNVEATVKVLNGCGINNRYWVFGSGMTNVEVEMLVIDRQTGLARSYTNTLGQSFAPILDTNAFASCSSSP
jgi:hypothetical protein